jgi:HSP20 family protein
MELMRYEPWLRLTRPEWLLRFFKKELLEEPEFGETDELTTECFVPAVDIREKDNAFLLEAELPGMKKEDIKLDVKEGVLTIRGERNYEHEEKKDNYTRVERCYGTFHRSFTLPDHVETEKIDATYKDGILTVTLPKNETATPKQIDVKIQ